MPDKNLIRKGGLELSQVDQNDSGPDSDDSVSVANLLFSSTARKTSEKSEKKRVIKG